MPPPDTNASAGGHASDRREPTTSTRGTPRVSGEEPVALAVPDLAGGGAELAVLRLAEGLQERGVPVEVVGARAEGDFLERMPEGVPFFDLDVGTPVLFWKTLRLARYLRERRPRILISTLDVGGAALWAKKLARVRTPVVFWEQTNLTKQFNDKYGPVGGFLRAALLRASRPRAEAVVACSRGVADDLTDYHARVAPERLHVAYNPIVTPQTLAQAREPVDHPWFAPGEPPVVLGVGRLADQKDFHTLVRAFALVREQCPARLIIIGQAETDREHQIQEELEALAAQLGVQEDVDLAGFTQNPYAYMGAASVFALSSAYEGFALALGEALAIGTPVVSTDCPSGPAELLEDGRWGPLVPVGAPAALADAIGRTLDDPPPSEALRERGQQFSAERFVDQYLDVIESVAPVQ